MANSPRPSDAAAELCVDPGHAGSQSAGGEGDGRSGAGSAEAATADGER